MIRAARLQALSVTRHAFFTREGGLSAGLYAGLNCGLGSNDDRAIVERNRALALERLGLAAGRLCTVHQVHGTAVAHADGPWTSTAPVADAVITTVPGLAVAVLTADCVPVLLAEPDAGIVGAVHCGWKGTLSGVLEAALEAIEARGGQRTRLIAAVGPAIAQPSYEVGVELEQQFTAADPASDRFFRAGRSPRHRQFDLPGYVVERLRRNAAAVIERIDHDTYSDPQRFYSFRRTTHRGEPDYGRQLSAIALA
ncbi:MAG: peptidoglycan editing factor PgeF [Alphaproteobacteria bacterium]|nr:peptidoglycan editing factor PgeF [Alphaproteobacteria bacterium]